MAMYSFRDCLASEVKTQEVVIGSFLVCRDSGDMYYDNPEGERVQLGKTVHVVDGKISSEMFPEAGHIYYSTTDKIIGMYHNGKMEPINLSTLGVVRRIAVDAGKTETVTISPNNEFTGMAAANTTAQKIGDIFAVVPVSLITAPSIADLDGELVGDGTVKMTVTNSEENGWQVGVINNHMSMQWMGNIEVAVIMIPTYQ